ncbi:MAG: type IV conjugative transfer system protein TraL [Sphingomonadales bacterium]|jgi:conjugal transfer pilus assembly protein TraL|nr:type IV conjugative transfer system protein TraL [Sphingomonadales bacterium]
MDRYAIPVFLDEPERIGLWTVDEFAAMAAPFITGILSQHIIIGLVAGFGGWWGLRKAKAGKATSWLLHMAYWHLPSTVTGIQHVPPSHLRLMAG